MEIKEFIRARVQNIIASIPTLRASYEYLSDIDAHIIEIVPLQDFNQNEQYLTFEKDIYKEFASLYLPSTLLFVSEDSINRVENPEWTIEGTKYGVMIQWSDKLNIAGFSIEQEYYKLSSANCSVQSCTVFGDNNYALAA